jgi:hypothetical protein
MKALLFVQITLATVVLTGCATLSEEECKTANWPEIGYADGREGHPRSRLESHDEACAKVGVRPAREAYFAGRERGLEVYCTPENGFRVGRDGQSYSHVCPASSAKAFVERYEAGRRIYEAEQRVERAENERRTLEQRLDRAKDDAERRQIRDQLRDLDRRLRNERDALFHTQRLWAR